MRRLGSRVTVVERNPRWVHHEDLRISAAMDGGWVGRVAHRKLNLLNTEESPYMVLRIINAAFSASCETSMSLTLPYTRSPFVPPPSSASVFLT